MTVYTVTGHIIGPSPTLDYVEPEQVRADLQTKGVGSTYTVTLQAADDTGHKNRGSLK